MISAKVSACPRLLENYQYPDIVSRFSGKLSSRFAPCRCQRLPLVKTLAVLFCAPDLFLILHTHRMTHKVQIFAATILVFALCSCVPPPPQWGPGGMGRGAGGPGGMGPG
ncbi:MAG: hypothetical protein ABI318_19460, partial [Chthoniobacteraceae bacterium]